MHPGQSILKFSKTYLDGWNGTSWVQNVSVGSLQTYDRFISARTFGQKKRTFVCALRPIDTSIPAGYEVVRLPDGTVHLVESKNADIWDNKPYAVTYMLHECPLQVQVVRFTTATLASGYPGSKTETTVGTYWADIERITVDSSNEFRTNKYSHMSLFIQKSADITTDDEIVVGSERYSVLEVNDMLLIKEARILKQ